MSKKSKRLALVKRKTSETDIQIRLAIDGKGKCSNQTGVPFLDHMLNLLAKHGLFDLDIKAKGDLEIDNHHTNEDVGITLGQAFAQALGDKAGIRRYGFGSVPMDEVLARVTLDFSGRPSLHIHKDKSIKLSRSEPYTFHDASEFLRAMTQNAGINMHVELLSGEDTHHLVEGVFKALAKALDMATQVDPRVQGIPSTKGKL